jgi:anthranilate phosphoribosyltransferase
MTLSLIDRVEAGHMLTHAEAEAVMEELLSGRAETAEIVRLLTALNKRLVQVQELAGFARRAEAREDGGHVRHRRGRFGDV